VARGTVTCNKCACSNQRRFSGELTVSFSQLKNVNLAPIYVPQDVLICLDCGHIELSLPAKKLEQLKQGACEAHTPGDAGSINS